MPTPHDTWTKDAGDSVGELAEWKLPLLLTDRLRLARDPGSVAAFVRDAILAIPNPLGLGDVMIHLISQRIRGHGPVRDVLAHAMDMIPPIRADLVRAGIDPDTARDQLSARFTAAWNNPLNPFHQLPGGHMPAPTPAPTTPATAASHKSKIQTALFEEGFSPEQIAIILMLTRLSRIEKRIGTDLFQDLEGDAAKDHAGLIETLKENAKDMQKILAAPHINFAVVEQLVGQIRAGEIAGIGEGQNRTNWLEKCGLFVRHVLPVCEFILLGYAERHPGTDAAASLIDMIDRLNILADLEPSSGFLRAKKVSEMVKKAGKGVGVGIALLCGYLTSVIVVAYYKPLWLDGYAWFWTLAFIAMPILAAIAGAIPQFKRGWLMPAGYVFAAGFTLPAVMVSWAIAAIFTPGSIDGRAFWFPPIAGLVLDFVVLRLVDKGASVILALKGVVMGIFRGIREEDAKAFSEKMVKANFLSGIGSTISAAVALLWAPIGIAFLCDTPAAWRQDLIGVIVIAALTWALMKSSAQFKNYGGLPASLAKIIESEDGRYLKMASRGAQYVILAALLFMPAIKWIGVKDMDHGMTRTANAVSNTGGKVLDGVEWVVGSPASASTPAPAPSTPAQTTSVVMVMCGDGVVRNADNMRKLHSDLNRKLGEEYCTAAFMGDIPCSCR